MTRNETIDLIKQNLCITCGYPVNEDLRNWFKTKWVNIGKKDKVKEVVDAAKANKCYIRVGVNAGSLEKHLLNKYINPTPQAMLESALYHLKTLEELNFYNTKMFFWAY